MRLATYCLLLLFSFNLFGLEVPYHSSPVEDNAQLLQKETIGELNRVLSSVYKQGGPQVQVLIIPSLEGEVLEEYSIRVANTWQLGSKSEDNGVLLLVALKDRKTRIEVGSGLEGDLTDVESSRILDGVSSFFKEEKFDDGILFAVKAILEKVNVQVDDSKMLQEVESPSTGLPFDLILVIIFIIILLLLFLTGNGDIALMLMYAASGRGSSSSSGGYSGGGGGFSGGGSSGSW